MEIPVIEDWWHHFVGDSPVGVWPGGTYYTDGSGGDESSDPLLGRVGAAAAQLHVVDGRFCFAWGWFSPVPGSRQTVPLAELAAVLQVLRRVSLASSLHFVVDSRITVDRLNLIINGTALPTLLANKDMWKEVFAIVSRRRRARATTTCIWIKSHPTCRHIAEHGISVQDAMGNAAADVLADKAAKLARVGAGDVGRARWWAAALWHVQNRLIAIAKMDLAGCNAMRKCAARQRRLKLLEAEQERQGQIANTLSAKVLMSRHRVVVKALPHAVMYCVDCWSIAPSEGKDAWLGSACSGSGHIVRKGLVAMGSAPVVVGGRRVHASHEIHCYSGLFVCIRCGHTGGTKLQTLKEVCSGVMRPVLGRQLKRIRNGKLPGSLPQWRCQDQGRRALLLGWRF